MAIKMRPTSHWYPSLDAWWVSSLEIVGVFHERLNIEDFDSPESYSEITTLVHSLPTLKNGYQLNEEQVKVIRGCFKTIEARIISLEWSIRPKDSLLHSPYGLCGVHKLMMQRFLKLLPYSVAYLPPRIGIQPEVTIDAQLGELPVNMTLIGGILRTAAQAAFIEERKRFGIWSMDGLKNNFCEQAGEMQHLSSDAAELVEAMSTALVRYRKELEAQRKLRSRDKAAFDYVINQIDRFNEKYLYVSLAESSVLH